MSVPDAMPELEIGQSPKDWPNYSAARERFTDRIAGAASELAEAVIRDGGDPASAVNASCHELLWYAAFLACENVTKNLGREPRREQWDAVVGQIFDAVAGAMSDPTFAVAS